MTSLLPSLAALFVMGSSPLAFQAEYSFVAPEHPATLSHAHYTRMHQAPVLEPVEIKNAPAAKPTPAKLQTVQYDEPDTAIAPPPAAEPAVTDSNAVSATERRAILKAAATSLSDAETARGRFTQVAPDGSVTHGDFALRRPGRMRFDYDAPTPILIVSDGTTVAMEDSDLETVDRVPLASTPLGLILDDELDFETEARVTDVRRADGKIAITIEDRSGESEGTLTLVFDASNYQLLSWNAVDANRQTTTVSLSDIETNVKVDPRLFRMDDPADEDEDER